MELHKLIATLETCKDDLPTDVPSGVKENRFFVVNNDANIRRRQNGAHSKFYDDRGAWANGPTSKTLFHRQPEGQLKTVVMKNGLYCREQQRHKIREFVPLDPQPETSDIVVLHRFYTKHVWDPTYEKRVSYLEYAGAPATACHEYRGTCPHPKPHCRTTSGQPGNYVRMNPQKMTELKESLKTKRPYEAYYDAAGSDLEGPRNKKQTYNAKFRMQASELPHQKNKSNFADQVQTLESMQDAFPFIRRIIRMPLKVPVCILYSREQIADIVRFCCPPHSAQSTVLCVDKTFNLADVHVTTTVYKHLAVLSRRTGEHPCFLGPYFLHGNSDAETYVEFFQHLSLVLGKQQQPVFGSDEEAAIRQAMKEVFPGSVRMVCTLHLRKNLNAHLSDSGQIDKRERKGLLCNIFGKEGVAAKPSDPVAVKDEMDTIIETAAKPKVTKFLQKVSTCLQENARARQLHPGLMLEPGPWTNNASESMNNVLKHAVDWKSLKLPDLVHTLRTVAESRQKEVERAFVGLGEYVLDENFKKFALTKEAWFKKTKAQREKRFARFLSTPKEICVRSTDGQTVARAPGHKGRKPGQRRRKRAERTQH